MGLWHAATVPLLISCVALAACSSKPATSGSDAFTASGFNRAGRGPGSALAAGGDSGTGSVPVVAGEGRAGGAGNQAAGRSRGRGQVAYGSTGGEAAGGIGEPGAPADAEVAAMGTGATVLGNRAADGSAGVAAGAAVTGAAGGAGSSSVSASVGGAGDESQTGAGGPQAGLDGQRDSDARGVGGDGAATGAMGAGVGSADGVGSAGGRSPLAGFRSIPELGDIHFEYDAYQVRPADTATLDAGARWLRSNPKHVVLIEGHCDERGTQEYNLALGEHRAKSTMTYLVSQGVEPHRIQLISYGKERPVCTEGSDACWSRNRRAHFLVK